MNTPTDRELSTMDGVLNTRIKFSILNSALSIDWRVYVEEGAVHSRDEFLRAEALILRFFNENPEYVNLVETGSAYRLTDDTIRFAEEGGFRAFFIRENTLKAFEFEKSKTEHNLNKLQVDDFPKAKRRANAALVLSLLAFLISFALLWIEISRYSQGK